MSYFNIPFYSVASNAMPPMQALSLSSAIPSGPSPNPPANNYLSLDTANASNYFLTTSNRGGFSYPYGAAAYAPAPIAPANMLPNPVTPADFTTPPSPQYASANVPAAGGAWPQAGATPMATVQSTWGAGYAGQGVGAGATGQMAAGAGATPLGTQGASFAGGVGYQMPQGAGATPLGTQGPSLDGGVQSQLALMNQRLNSFLGQAGTPAAAPLEGHEWMASIISPPPENPNNYLGGLVNGGK